MANKEIMKKKNIFSCILIFKMVYKDLFKKKP